MGVAYYVSLDLDLPELDSSVDGKRVAESDELLNEIASENDMPEIMEFFGMDSAEIESLLGEEGIPEQNDWHDAGEGARYFSRMGELLALRPDAAAHVDLLAELKDFADVLTQAHAAGAKWRLAMDF